MRRIRAMCNSSAGCVHGMRRRRGGRGESLMTESILALEGLESGDNDVRQSVNPGTFLGPSNYCLQISDGARHRR